MHNERKISEDIWWIGANDRRLERFENMYPIPEGVSYNSYLVLDEKTVLLDGIDQSGERQYLENLEFLLKGRKLDYLVVNHMEPDHCAVIGELAKRYPEVQIVGNPKTFRMIRQFFDFDPSGRELAVKEGDTLCTGRHTFTFVMCPMVHWPETMVTYDCSTKTLFSGDAFGTFGTIDGNLYADEIDFDQERQGSARRYYTNIVGKYGAMVTALLKKAARLEIRMICPLHGPIWRKDFDKIISLYQKWASYTPETESVMIYYASVYGDTANAAELLAFDLAEQGIRDIRVADVSKTDLAECVAMAFKYSHLVFAATTYNGELFTSMKTLIDDLRNHLLCNRTVGLIENGTWAPMAGEIMKKAICPMKDLRILEPTVTLHSGVKEADRQAIAELAGALAATLK